MAGACFRDSSHADVNRNNYQTWIICIYYRYIFIKFRIKVRNVSVPRFIALMKKFISCKFS